MPTKDQLDERNHEGGQDARLRDVKVTVTFSLSDRPPFEDRVDPSTTVGSVRQAAMSHFGADEDPNSTYYLTHERERQSDDVTVGDLAGRSRRLKLRLVKELIQG